MPELSTPPRRPATAVTRAFITSDLFAESTGVAVRITRTPPAVRYSLVVSTCVGPSIRDALPGGHEKRPPGRGGRLTGSETSTNRHRLSGATTTGASRF